MHLCPNCKTRLEKDTLQCDKCGLIFSDKKIADMLIRRADALFKIGDIPGAIESYKKSMEYGIPEAKIKYAKIKLSMEDYDDVIITLKSLETREALEVLSIAYYNLGDYENAMSVLKKLLKMDKDNPTYLKNIGMCLQKLGRYQEALNYFDKCLGESEDANLLHMMAESLYHIGRREEAAEKLELCARITKNASTYSASAEIYIECGKYQNALRCVDEALNIDEKDSLWVLRGDVEMYMRNPLRAISHYDTALQMNEKNASAWSHKSVALENIGRYEEALMCVKKALEIDSRNVEVKKNMGEILLKMHRYTDAIKVFEEILLINKDYFYPYLKIGEAKMSLGKYKEAISALKKVVEMKDDVYDAWVALTIAYFNLGEYYECLNICDKAIEMHRDDYFMWYIKGSTHFMLGEYEEAYRDAETSLKLNNKFADAKRLMRLASLKIGADVGKTYRIEDVFIIYHDGRLLTHICRDPERTVDDVVLSGMFTAIQQFIREAFKFEGGRILEKMEMGEILILIEQWENLFAAVILSGEDNPDVRKKMKKMLKEIYDKYYNILKRWDGNTEKIKGINGIVMKNLLTTDER